MDHNDYSRREFLKRFAALSSAPLLLSLTGCVGSEYGPVAVLYGPGPVGEPHVYNMSFEDTGGADVVLYGYQGVPVTTTFIIDFTTTMDTTAPLVVALHDDTNNNTVALDAPVWAGNFSATVAPSAALLNGTDYTLSVTDAMNSRGEHLIVDSNATASFKTS